MYLLISIVLSAILGLILLMMGPFGGVIAFGIVLGCLFRGLYLLKDIHSIIVPPKKDKVQVAYDSYIEKRDISSS